MKAAVQLQTATEDARSLLAAARTGSGRPVRQCPGWDAAELVRHMGGILVWMAAVVSSGERVHRRALDPGPQDDADLPAWYLACLDRAIKVLGFDGPGSGTWTFSSTAGIVVWPGGTGVLPWRSLSTAGMLRMRSPLTADRHPTRWTGTSPLRVSRSS